MNLFQTIIPGYGEAVTRLDSTLNENVRLRAQLQSERDISETRKANQEEGFNTLQNRYTKLQRTVEAAKTVNEDVFVRMEILQGLYDEFAPLALRVVSLRIRIGMSPQEILLLEDIRAAVERAPVLDAPAEEGTA